MSDAAPEVTARIRLFSKQEANPKTFPLSPALYECPLYYNEQYYDCQVVLDRFAHQIEMGTSFEAPIKFQWPPGIVARLKTGDSFCLWEDGIIGEGKITAVQHGADYENIKRTFNVEDLRRYVHLCIRFAELASAKSNITLWRELEEGGALVQVLDEIHELRQKYDVVVAGQPFFHIWVFDPEESILKKACQKKKLEKWWD